MMKSCRWLPHVLLGLGVWIAMPGCATRLAPARGGYGETVQRRGFDEGRRRGFDRGRNDARRGRERSYDEFSEYRDGDNGYRRDDGDRDAYRDDFRRGFRAGYAEAFSQRRDQDERSRRR